MPDFNPSAPIAGGSTTPTSPSLPNYGLPNFFGNRNNTSIPITPNGNVVIKPVTSNPACRPIYNNQAVLNALNSILANPNALRAKGVNVTPQFIVDVQRQLAEQIRIAVVVGNTCETNPAPSAISAKRKACEDSAGRIYDNAYNAAKTAGIDDLTILNALGDRSIAISNACKDVKSINVAPPNIIPSITDSNATISNAPSTDLCAGKECPPNMSCDKTSGACTFNSAIPTAPIGNVSTPIKGTNVFDTAGFNTPVGAVVPTITVPNDFSSIRVKTSIPENNITVQPGCKPVYNNQSNIDSLRGTIDALTVQLNGELAKAKVVGQNCIPEQKPVTAYNKCIANGGTWINGACHYNSVY